MIAVMVRQHEVAVGSLRERPGNEVERALGSLHGHWCLYDDEALIRVDNELTVAPTDALDVRDPSAIISTTVRVRNPRGYCRPAMTSRSARRHSHDFPHRRFPKPLSPRRKEKAPDNESFKEHS